MCQIKSYIFFPLATVLKYSYAGLCMCSDRTKTANRGSFAIGWLYLYRVKHKWTWMSEDVL